MNQAFRDGYLSLLAAAFLAAAWSGRASAAGPLSIDGFGSGSNSFSIEFVEIGNPGNPPDTSGNPNPAGSVDYAYRIGKYEISEQMIDKANALGGLGITKDMRGPDKPATSVSWFEAARFVNWLNTSTGNTPAYKFDASGDFHLWAPGDPGYDAANLFRNSQAKYFLPSANEWYKAAFYDPTAGVYWDFPTGSNMLPVPLVSGTTAGTAVVMQNVALGPAATTAAGGLSPYETMAQGGNVNEWEETAFDLTNNDPSEMRAGRGGSWADFASSLAAPYRFATTASNQGGGLGFRIVSVIPEPSPAEMVGVSIALLGIKRKALVVPSKARVLKGTHLIVLAGGRGGAAWTAVPGGRRTA